MNTTTNEPRMTGTPGTTGKDIYEQDAVIVGEGSVVDVDGDEGRAQRALGMVRQHPYAAVGIAMGIGMAFGKGSASILPGTTTILGTASRFVAGALLRGVLLSGVRNAVGGYSHDGGYSHED